MQGKAILRVSRDERFKALQSGPSPLAWVRIPHLTMYFFQSFFEVKNYMQRKAILRVRMAERSKALRSGRSPLLWAWVKELKWGKLFSMSGWPSGLRRCVQVAVHFCGRGMAKRSKALRSCRSPPGFGVGSKTKCKETLSWQVRMADRSKALRFDHGHIPLLWAWDGQAVKGAAFMSKSTRFWRGHFLRLKTTCKGNAKMAESSILRGLSGWPHPWQRRNEMAPSKPDNVTRMDDRCKALRLDHIPLLWAWVPNTKCKETLSQVRMADRSKALRFDHVPLLWAWDGQAVKGAAFISKSTRFWRGSHKVNVKETISSRFRMAKWSKALRSCRSPLAVLRRSNSLF
ncbi:hypothetical protein TNCV_1381661 [Trichonephila clavipes]|nr:hypothetical protein TNCV_1381661 [Trichonephila clavipes]